jgi:hypothetical protein
MWGRWCNQCKGVAVSVLVKPTENEIHDPVRPADIGERDRFPPNKIARFHRFADAKGNLGHAPIANWVAKFICHS